MRIIAGAFKGKKIFQPKDDLTRPLKDLVKESIFNIINHSNKITIQLENSIVLDLFAGVGSFGLECLSRNARYVIFIENYKESLAVLNKNLHRLNLFEKFKVFNRDIINSSILENINNIFDIIYIDPPYKEKNISIILDSIVNNNLLSDNGIIILHRHKKEIDLIPLKLKIFEEKKYGISKIIFLKKN